MDEIIRKLKEWVNQNYNSIECGWTAKRSYGNFDDCFNDGCSVGTSWAAYDVGQILGMNLEEPEEPDDE